MATSRSRNLRRRLLDWVLPPRTSTRASERRGDTRCVSVMLISLASRVAADVALAGRARRPDRWALVASTEWSMAEVSPRDEGVARAARARVRAGFNSLDRDNAVVVDADKVSPTCPLPMNIETNADLPYSEASRGTVEPSIVTQTGSSIAAAPDSSETSAARSPPASSAAFSPKWPPSPPSAPHVRVERRRAGFVDWQSVPHDPIPPPLVPRRQAPRPSVHPRLPRPRPPPRVPHERQLRAGWIPASRGRVVSHCRNIMRQSSTWMREDVDPADGGGCDGPARLGFPSAWRRTSPVRTTSEDSATSSLRVGERGANRLFRAPNRPLQAWPICRAPCISSRWTRNAEGGG